MWLIPRPRQRDSVPDTLAALKAALVTHAHDATSIRPHVQRFLKAAQRDRLSNDAAVAAMVPLLEPPYDEAIALVAVACGALIEAGAAAEPAAELALDGVRSALGDPAVSEGCLDLWLRLACAVAQRLPAARRELIADPQVLSTLINRGAEDHISGPLLMLLQAPMRERMLVLHPASGRGFWIEVDGVVDNLQLHTLLAAALIGDGGQGLPGSRPSSDLVRSCSEPAAPEEYVVDQGWFNLAHWTALGQLGPDTEDVPSEHWIWNEGRPADILPFEGTRVIVMLAPPYPRSWSAARIFPALPAVVEVLGGLSHGDYTAWVSKLRAAAGECPAH